MDGLSPVTLTWESGVASFMIAGAIWAFLYGLKKFLDWTPWMWTCRIPGWIWWLTSAALACAVTCTLKIDQLGQLFGAASIDLPWPLGYIGTGLAISTSSNLLHIIQSPLGVKYRNAKGKVLTLPAGTPIPTDTPSIPNPPAVPSVPADLEPSEGAALAPTTVNKDEPYSQLDKNDSKSEDSLVSLSTAMLLMEREIPSGPRHYVWIPDLAGGHLYPIERGDNDS